MDPIKAIEDKQLRDDVPQLQPGDNVRVQVARASLEKKQLDFVLIDDRGRRPGEDTLGKTVTARQALSPAGSRRKSSQHKGGRRNKSQGRR